MKFAFVVLCFAVGCSQQDPGRVDSFTEILQKRARHLQGAERERIVQGLLEAERQTGINALLLVAVVEEESHFRTLARSRRNALGLMQVRPATARDVCERNQLPWDGEASLLEPSLNLLIGATYLAELRDRFGTWDLALTAYNQGPTKAGRAATRGRSPSSRYAARVLRRFDLLRQPTDETTGPQTLRTRSSVRIASWECPARVRS